MNEKKLTALVGVLAFGIAGMALVPVGMDAGAEHMPLAQANEGTDHCEEFTEENLENVIHAIDADEVLRQVEQLEEVDLDKVLFPELEAERSTTKDGTEITTIVNVEIIWSIHVFFFNAAQIPSKIPIGTEKITAKILILIEYKILFVYCQTKSKKERNKKPFAVIFFEKMYERRFCHAIFR